MTSLLMKPTSAGKDTLHKRDQPLKKLAYVSNNWGPLLSLELASQATRKHWHIENQQHWALDVIFKEDEQCIYAGDSALNMACCRRFVQNLFRKPEGNLSVPRKMNKAVWDKDYRASVLFTSN